MHLLDHSPRIAAETAVEIGYRYYGIRGSVEALPSERDQNFLLTSETGGQFVLKISNSLEDPALLEAQNAILSHLEHRVDICQHIVKTIDGNEMTRMGSDPDHFLRLVNFIPGTPLAK